MGWACSTYGERCTRGFGGETEGKRPLVRTRSGWADNIKIEIQEVG